MHRRIVVTIGALAAQLALAAVAAAQTTLFVTTLANDTLSLERYTRAGRTVTGDWVTFYGGILFHHYVLTLRPDGTVEHLSLALHRANGHPEGSVELAFDAESVTVAASRDSGRTQRVAAPGAFPVLGGIMALREAITMRARASGRDSSLVAALPAFGPYTRGNVPVVFFGADSARLGSPLAPTYLRVDRAGHILGMSGRATTVRSETRRVPAFDLVAVARHFPDVPAETPIVGAPAISPRDTVRATIGAVQVTVDYGRPATRGRDVFSHGVLGDTVWRTGANAATQFTTTADLVIGGKTLPAGKYSLWTHVPPDNSSYELVFNQQVGQWGTEHHFDRDLLSVPLAARPLDAPVERFTIAVEPGESGSGVLRLRWGKLELSAPMAPK